MILALWTVCFLSTLAVILGYGVRQKAIVVRRLEQKNKLSLIAEAGIEKAIAELTRQAQEPKAYLSLQDSLCNDPPAFQRVTVGEGSFSVYYHYIDEESGQAQTIYGLRDEESKININQADLAVLKSIFTQALGYAESQAEELAAAVIDWRDADSASATPSSGAENPYYHSLSFPYDAKDAAFEVPDELFLVKGFTQQVIENLKDYITIYGSGKVNINTASAVVLRALGLSPGLVSKILAFRKGTDKILGTSDDNIFAAALDIVPKLTAYYNNMSVAETEELNIAAEQYLVVNSSIFMISSFAQLNSGRSNAEVICVADREGRIFYWHES